MAITALYILNVISCATLWEDIQLLIGTKGGSKTSSLVLAAAYIDKHAVIFCTTQTVPLIVADGLLVKYPSVNAVLSANFSKDMAVLQNLEQFSLCRRAVVNRLSCRNWYAFNDLLLKFESQYSRLLNSTLYICREMFTI